MRKAIAARRGAFRAAAFAMMLAALATLKAQQVGGGGANTPKPLLPVAANTVAAHPDPYYGEGITMTAAVDQILSPTTFTISQRTAPNVTTKPKVGGEDTLGILVVAPTLREAVVANAYVTVFGELVRFDPDAVSQRLKDYKLDVSPDALQKYRGRPAVLATSVINNAMVDIAKKLPPPMTADEEALSKVMKRVGPAFAALRTAADASTTDAAAKSAAELKQAFAETETFWKPKGKADATQWAQDARKHVDAITQEITAGNWDAVKTSAGTLGQACQSCHGAYRDRMDDGTYRIKTGGK